MGELGIIAKVAMANTFAMYFKAHSYHWNIEGRNFSEYHGFFGSMYEELHDAIDPMAEQIRAIDAYAPISIMDMFHFKMVTEDSSTNIQSNHVCQSSHSKQSGH